jgi:RNA polymerase sigma-70 factor (ECF subfamily)
MFERDLNCARDVDEWQSDDASDGSLVLVAQSGDHKAFTELRRRHAKKLLPRIYRITRSWEDAEDVLQDSFLKAFVHLKTFEGRSSFSSWLTRIAINSALMTLRKRRIVEISIDSPLIDGENWSGWELADNGRNPEEEYVQRELEQNLRHATRQLRPALRRVVHLRRTEGYSTSEIAAVLGISPSAAKSRLMRAKTALRASMP